ncbi:hypothetical protein BDW72DRAFT_201139 [Aspergillus terricola var. indicus]
MALIPWGMLYVSVAGYSVLTSNLFTFFVLATALTALRIIYASFLYPEYLTPIKHIPTPALTAQNRSWIKGNTDTYVVISPFDGMLSWTKSVPNNGLLRYYIIGNIEHVLVTTPKALSELLVQNAYDYQKPESMRASLARITGDHGILLVEGQEHKRHRKNLMPAFSYRHIKDLYSTFWAKSVEMVKCIEKDLQDRKDGGDNTVTVRPWASRATLDIIGLAGMDRDFGSLADPHNELAAQYHRVLEDAPLWLKLLFAAGFVLGTERIVTALPVKRNRNIAEGARYVRQVAQQLIREKRERIKHTPNKVEGGGGGKDILSVALSSGKFTDLELVDQMMTFIAAGHETTSSALQWSVYALCKHPDIQTRLRQEIRSNLPSIASDDPEPITAEAVDSLAYLHAFCNEVLRFHPSVPITFRTTTRDTTLAGSLLPKGTQLTISPEVINHDPELWGPDAHVFNPERWLGPGRANTGGASSNYALMTFLHGPRSCIGQGFAKAELACLVAAMVGMFEMELADPGKKLEVKRTATISPVDGVVARLTPLDGW